MINRRNFLKGAGAFVVLAASGTLWRANTQGVFSVNEGAAYEPWQNWRDPKFALVRAAILAASPHNTQPWLFRVSESRIDLFADRARNIGAIDSDLREMHIGLGCAIENMMLAATTNGVAANPTLLPTPSDATHVARIDLAPGEKKVSPLYEAIPNRHTNRAAYDVPRPIAAETINTLQSLINDPDLNVIWFTTEEAKKKIGKQIVEASLALIADKQQSDDSAKWERLTWEDVQRERDGITLDAQGLPLFINVAAKILPPTPREQNDQIFIQRTRDVHVATAAAFGILAARNARDNAQRLKGGRTWQRLQLWMTTQGLAAQPLNQMAERADREESLKIEPHFGNILRELIGDSDWQALMPFRIGYPTEAALKSPRRAVESTLLN